MDLPPPNPIRLPPISTHPSTSASGRHIARSRLLLWQDLRLLAADGALPHNMYASDISRELWQLGFELFRDREKIFDPGSGLGRLSGQMNIVRLGAAGFGHEKDCGDLRSGSVLVG